MDDLTKVPQGVLVAEAALREESRRIQQRLHSAARSVEEAGNDPALLERGLSNHELLQAFRNEVAAFHAAHERLRHALHAGGGEKPWDGTERRKRCGICDWPFSATAAEGCVQGNCSYRPDRSASFSEWARVHKNRENNRRRPPIFEAAEVPKQERADTQHVGPLTEP